MITTLCCISCAMPCLLDCAIVAAIPITMVAILAMIVLGGIPALIVLCASTPILEALFGGSTITAIIAAILSPYSSGRRGTS